MTYESFNAAQLFGSNTSIPPLLANGVLYDGIQTALECLRTNCIEQPQLQAFEHGIAATVTIADVKLKLHLSSAGILDAFADRNADGDFSDAGETLVTGFNLATVYGADRWAINLGQSLAPLSISSNTSLTPGAKPEPPRSNPGSGTSLDPGAKPEPPRPPVGMPPVGTPPVGTPPIPPTPPVGTPPIPPTPPVGTPPIPPTPPVGTPPPPPFEVPPPVGTPPVPPTPPVGTPPIPPTPPVGTPPPPPFEVPDGGTPPPTIGAVAPIFVVPQGPAGFSAGVSNAVISGIDLLGFDASNYTFTVLNGAQSINGARVIDNRFIVENGQLRLATGATLTGGGPFNLVIEAADAQGNSFRSSNLSLFANNGTLQIGGAGAGNTVIYAEGAAPTGIISNLILDGSAAGAPSQLTGATVTIGSGYVAGEDFLSIAGAPSGATSGTVDGLNWSFANGVLTLSGAGSVAAYQNALRQVTYFNSSQNPSSAARTVNVLIGGGPVPFGQANLVIDIAGTNNAGSFDFLAAPSTITGTAGAVAGPITVNDPDSRYSLAVGGGFGAQFGVASAGPNSWQLFLRSGQTLAPGSYSIPLTATDVATGATLTQNYNFTVTAPAAGAYTLGGLLPAAGSTATATYAERQATPLAVASGFTLAGGPAGGSLNGASVGIVGYSPVQLERLGIAGQAGNSGAIAGTTITWVYDPATGVMTFSGAGTAADYQAALRQVTYSNASNAPLAARFLNYTVGTGATAGQGFATIGINGANDLPTALSLSSQLVPTGQAGAVFANLNVTDVDGPNGAYTYAVTGGGDLFEVVNGQLKLKAGSTIAPGQVIPDVSITVIDAGAPNGGRYTQTFGLSTGGGTPSEIYWRNGNNNSSVFWNLNNGREVVGGSVLRYGAGIGDDRAGQPVLFPAAARVVGLSDMNGDGANDIVLVNGRDITVATIGEFNGRPVSVESFAAPVFASPVFGALNGQAARPVGSYQLAGLADMTGDGQADYVFTGAPGDGVVIWTANRQNQITNGTIVTGAPPVPGNLEAVLDLDGDGDQDFLWRNGGKAFVWLMNGTQFVRQVVAPPSFLNAPADFTMDGVGDFDGNGIQDVVWHSNSRNSTVIWLFDTQGLQTSTILPTVSSGSWQIGAVADMDGDGTSDILWRNNAADETVFWRIRGGQLDLPNSGFVLNRTQGNQGGAFKTQDPAWNIAGANGVVQTTPAVTPVV